ncbi:Gfo/Idh/MocA family oxidoreductase [bacterium]|nr:Gfo/Idh/MocA family oxidoreductase [bacterium]
MSSNQSIRVGVVGAGANTKLHHIPKLQAQAGVEVVSVANRTRASAERVAREFQIPTVYDHWEELVAASDTNAIVIGTWPYLHCPVTVAALAAGKHVLCEARMASDAAEARRMWRTAHAHPQLVAQVVPSPMTLGVDGTIQRLLAEGLVGQVLAVEVRAGGTFLDRESPRHWRQDAQLSGINIMSLGIWYEALLRWVGGATRVMAMGKIFVRQRRDAAGHPAEIRVPEHLDVIADLDGGGQLHLLISSVAALAGPPEGYIFGSDGTLRLVEGRLFGGRRGETALQEIPIPPAAAGGWRVEEEFVNAIRGKEPVKLTTFADGVVYMEFTEAVARSLATGAAVSLPLQDV